MKRFSKLTALLSAGALLFGGLFLSCSDDGGDDDPVLKEIVAGGAPTALTVGDNFALGTVKVYAYYDNDTVGTFSEPGAAGSYTEVTSDATYTASDSASTVLKVGEAVNLAAGTYEITVTYGGKTAATKLSLTVSAATTGGNDTVDLEEVAAGWTGSVTGGAWWTVFAGTSAYDGKQVASGKKLTTTMEITGVGTEAWEAAPCVILYKSDNTEYGVVRPDNWGWGTAIGEGAVNYKTSDWGEDSILTYANGSTLTITVKNYGTGTADILYDFTKDGTTHYQYYKGIPVTADDLYTNLTFQNCNVEFTTSSESGSTAQITASASWDFASLAGTACKAVDASTALADAAALAAASVTATSFTDGMTKFSIQEDVAYTATSGSGSLTIKALGNDEKPIQYNKYESSTLKGDGSAGCLQIKDDAIVIEGVQGPFTIEAVYGSNASSDKTDRNMYIKVGGETVKESESTIPVAATGFSYAYTGTDAVDVVVGATGICRLYDVKITK